MMVILSLTCCTKWIIFLLKSKRSPVLIVTLHYTVLLCVYTLKTQWSQPCMVHKRGPAKYHSVVCVHSTLIAETQLIYTKYCIIYCSYLPQRGVPRKSPEYVCSHVYSSPEVGNSASYSSTLSFFPPIRLDCSVFQSTVLYRGKSVTV